MPELFIEALKTNKSYVREYRIRRKDGEISWIQALGGIFCDDAGKVDHISGIFFDITDRKQAEAALKEKEEGERKRAVELQAVFDAVPLFIIPSWRTTLTAAL